MWDTVCQTYHEYMTFYRHYFIDQWNHIGPVGYGILLVSIGLFGWVLMKSSVKGPGS